MSQDREIETPIIGYIARLQHQMEFVTALIFNQQTSKPAIKAALRGLIANFPPNGKKELEKEYNRLNTDGVLSSEEAEQLYNKCHDWAYERILQDGFKAKPMSKEKPHINSDN